MDVGKGLAATSFLVLFGVRWGAQARSGRLGGLLGLAPAWLCGLFPSPPESQFSI